MRSYRFWGPVQCSRAARFRCPQTPSALTAALAAGLLRFWGPVQCSRAARAARFRCPQTPSALTAALAAGLLLFVLSVGGVALAGARGDVTGDGIVDGADADRVLEAVVGTRALSPAERAAADVDGDGDADVADAQLIRQRSATSAAPAGTTP